MTLAYARIACLDLDAFFVSVERLLDPSLVGKPVIVGAPPNSRGVVCSASYEARSFGVRSGMPSRTAGRLCPQGLFISSRHDRYTEVSRQVDALVARFAPIVQQASVDEWFLDFHGCESLYPPRPGEDPDQGILAALCACADAVAAEIGVPATVGLALTKPIAKIVCNHAKPEGRRLLRAGETEAFLLPLSVREWPGVGPSFEKSLHRFGLYTLSDVASADDDLLARHFHGAGVALKRAIRCLVDDPLGESRQAFRVDDRHDVSRRSISHETTFSEDLSDDAAIEAAFKRLCEKVCWRLRRHALRTTGVTVKLRRADFSTVTRSTTLAPCDDEIELFAAARDLWLGEASRPGRSAHGRGTWRLIGVAVSPLHAASDRRTLFDDLEGERRQRRLHDAVDALRERFGFDVIRHADARGPTIRNEDDESRDPRRRER